MPTIITIAKPHTVSRQYAKITVLRCRLIREIISHNIPAVINIKNIKISLKFISLPLYENHGKMEILL